jgi:hypothetical protein
LAGAGLGADRLGADVVGCEPLGAGLLVVVVWVWFASGSMYCELPADCASATAGATSASKASSPSALST